ncbi:MAG: T9SS type A sorting domain-containing protein, partial [Cytophagales bacterium]|nr:T9SS type A sorting domain-containing protein [Cytophagales bacterium]
IQRFSNNWKRITSINLSEAFDDSTIFKSDTSNSETLLSNAIDFINGQDSIGYIFMVSSNRSYSNNLDSSRARATRLTNRMTKKTSIDIINHAINTTINTYTYTYNSYNNTTGTYNPITQTYTNLGINYGNTMFYSYVSTLSNGSNSNLSSYYLAYYKYYNYSYSYYLDYYKQNLANFNTSITNSLSKYVGKIIESIDLVISPTNGFSYQKFSISGGESLSYANSTNPISLIGKYIGTFPMQLNLVYTYKGVQTITPLTINQQDAQNEPNIVATHWNGNYIRKYEGSSDKNILISVATTALKYRILSKMTAMLALEPSLGGKICTTCDENQPFTGSFYQNYVNTVGDSISRAYSASQSITNSQISTTALEDNSNSKIEFSAYPNPASEYITFTFDNPQLETSTLEIYDLTGSKVYTTEIRSDDIKTNFEWNLIGSNGSKLTNGFYVAILTIGDKKIRTKIIIQS